MEERKIRKVEKSEPISKEMKNLVKDELKKDGMLSDRNFDPYLKSAIKDLKKYEEEIKKRQYISAFEAYESQKRK